MATQTPIAALESLVDRLVEQPPAPGPLLSVYLDGRPNEHGRSQIPPFLRRELWSKDRIRGLPYEDRDGYEKDASRVEAWLREAMPPSANGAAVFACHAAGFFEAVAMEAPIEGHRLHLGRRPHVYPLLHLLDRYRRYVAVLADTRKTRVYVFGLNARLLAREVEGEPKHGVENRSPSELRYQRHNTEHYKHNLKEVAETLDRIVRAERIETVILAGDEVVIPLLRAELPKSLLPKLVDVMRLDARTPEHEVLEATLEAFLQHDARTDAEKVRLLLDEYRAGGLGVVGVGPTRLALEIGQVDELLLAADPSVLSVDAAELGAAAAGGGEDLRTVTADELATRARQTDAAVTFVEDASLLRDVGGVGGLLRYRITPRDRPVGPLGT